MSNGQKREKGGSMCRPEPLSVRDFRHELVNVAPQLRAFARSLCGSPDWADDLAQETMLRAWEARERFAAGTNFRAWTFTILRNLFYSETRRNKFKGVYDEAVVENILKAPPTQYDALDLGDVLRALQAIPYKYREALMLVAGAGLPYGEVARICEVAVGTVKSRVSRARRKLAECIDEGRLPKPRREFTLNGNAIDTFFAELQKVANSDSSLADVA